MPRLTTPMARNINVITKLRLLLQLGHEPINRHANGFPPPPTIPFFKPYNFRNPSAVNVAPTEARGKIWMTVSMRKAVLNSRSVPSLGGQSYSRTPAWKGSCPHGGNAERS